MNIKKIKLYPKEEKLTVIFEKKNSKGGWDELSITSKEAPEPEFLESLQGLRACLIDIAEMPKEDLENISVTGVSLSHCGTPDKKVGATLIGYRKLRKSNQGLSIVTPHKFSEFFSGDGDHKDLMPDGMIRLVEIVIEKASRFVSGHRAQQGMFDMARIDKKNDEDLPIIEASTIESRRKVISTVERNHPSPRRETRDGGG